MILEQPLETEHLFLREFKEDDYSAVREYAPDPEVHRFVVFGPGTEEDTQNFIHQCMEEQNKEPRETFTLAVILKSEGNGKLIGGCGLTLEGKGNANMGYLFNSRYWGNGYATEVARALLNFGFRQLGRHRIYATCDVRNIASARVMEKVGMRREAHFHLDVWLRDHWRDSFLYAILEQEWRANHEC